MHIWYTVLISCSFKKSEVMFLATAHFIQMCVPYFFGYRRVFSQDGSRLVGGFFYLIAKFHKIDFDIQDHSRDSPPHPHLLQLNKYGMIIEVICIREDTSWLHVQTEKTQISQYIHNRGHNSYYSFLFRVTDLSLCCLHMQRYLFL